MIVENKIRVLQIGMTPNIGGIETYLYQQFKHLDRNKIVYDFINFFPDRKLAYSEEILNGGGMIYSITGRGDNPVAHYYELFKLIKRIHYNYKAIVLNGLGLHYVFPLFLGKVFDIPMRILHSHNTNYENPKTFVRKMLLCLNKKIAEQCVTHRWACSKTAGEWMFGNNDFSIIPNSIDVDKFKFDEKIRTKYRKKLKLESEFAICHIGRFSYQKNHKKLIDIFNKLAQRRPDVVLYLIGGTNGDGDDSILEEIKKEVRDLALDNRIKFMGMRSDVNYIMQAMDCFILPSLFEGFPVVGVEAQASGLPCFFSDKITKEIGLSDLSHFFSLEDDDFANNIDLEPNLNRYKYADIIKLKGYDITTTNKDIMNFYLS